MKVAIEKAGALIEALPYIKKFQGRIFVIKYGGSMLKSENTLLAVLEDIAFLRYAGIRPVLIHGGGPHINERLKKLDVQPTFIDGLRVTDALTLTVVDEELGRLNAEIVSEINRHGELARGFTTKDCLLSAAKKKASADLGFVGEVTDCRTDVIMRTIETMIPVIMPLGRGADGTVYNINADDVAYFLAAHLKAEKLVFLSKEPGVMKDIKDEQSLISSIKTSAAESLIADGTVSGGMVPKVRAAVDSIHRGVRKVHIVGASIPHAILLEIFTDKGVGTQIVGDRSDGGTE